MLGFKKKEEEVERKKFIFILVHPTRVQLESGTSHPSSSARKQSKHPPKNNENGIGTACDPSPHSVYKEFRYFRGTSLKEKIEKDNIFTFTGDHTPDSQWRNPLITVNHLCILRLDYEL